MHPRASDLTICSVYHSLESRKLLELNGTLLDAINENPKITWLVADNAQAGSVEPIDSRRFIRVPGVSRDDLAPDIIPQSRGSFQHATAVNALLKRVETRFALILDNDFYIVRRNWIADVLAHIEREELVFFGSTWHPKYYTKYRYFPSVHCFFVDLARVDRATLDFRPQPEARLVKRHGSYSRRARPLKMPWLLARLGMAVTLRDRSFIGDSRDTGYRVFRAYRDREDLRRECLEPVLEPRMYSSRVARMLYWPNRFLELFLPDERSFIPKRRGYFTMRSFRDRGFPNASAMGFEEFFWQNQPFGIHLRGTRSHIGYAGRDFSRDFARVEALLKELIGAGSGR